MFSRSSKRVNTIVIVMFLGLFSSLHSISTKSQAFAEEILTKRLMIMNIDGSDAKILFKSDEFTALGSPTFSNDGKKIALDGWRIHKGENGSQARVLVINADGTGLKDLGDGAMPTWSHDGKKLAYSRYTQRGVWTMDADGKNQTLIRSGGWSAQWSPNGKEIAYTYGRKLNLYNVKTKETEVVEFPEDADIISIRWNISWSADSTSICFKGSNSNRDTILASIHLPSRDTIIHYTTNKQPHPSEDTAWLPNGEKIYFMMWTKETRSMRIFSFDPLNPDEAPKMLPGQDYDGTAVDGICCTPDGKKLIFTVNVKTTR